MNRNYKEILDIGAKKAKLYFEPNKETIKEFAACSDGKYFTDPKVRPKELKEISSWIQSFYTGIAYISYLTTNDKEYLMWVNSLYDDYYSKVFDTPMDTMHDLGFLYSPYAVALYKLSGDMNMKRIGVKAADELAKRFNPLGGYIRAWGRCDAKGWAIGDDSDIEGLAIVDCMMNLPLLFWASEVTGNPFYKKVAQMHADTTLGYFVRDDLSVYHAYRFDPESGKPLGGANYCGYDVESHWARGTTWAMYGFAVAYRYTKKKEFLDIAVNLSKKFISLCRKDLMPVWDFRLPKETSAIYAGKKEVHMDWDISSEDECENAIDTSAAAIASCAYLEILEYFDDEEISSALNKTIKTLLEKYINTDTDTPGLLCHQNGRMDYTIFGDYFLMEVLYKLEYGSLEIW